MEDKWISVKDRLPEKQKDYLVTDGNACMVSKFNNENQMFEFWEIFWWKSEDVTHWQELKLPKKY